jgi:hypothetical protein
VRVVYRVADRYLDWQSVPWLLKVGGMKDFWIINSSLIEQTIKEQGLKPLPPEAPVAREMPLVPMEEKAAPIIWHGPIYGGMRIAHLHFKGQIYPLNEDQWRKFSATVIKGFQAKLARANNVSFEHVMEISDAVDRLP